jgi:hypothetical protein
MIKSYAEEDNAGTGPDIYGEQGEVHKRRENKLVKQPGYTQFKL